MDDDERFDAWYSHDPENVVGTGDYIKVRVGSLFYGRQESLDIRDAVYFRYLLDGAIQDYERAVGR